MNCRALFSQEWRSAKVRHAARGIRSACRQAVRRSSLKTPMGLLPTTSFGPVTGKAAIGTPLAAASSCTTPNVSVRLGNTKTSAAARWAAKVPFSSNPRNFACGNRRLSSASCGPVPITTLVPGRSSERNASRFFSTAIRPTVTKTGRGKPSSSARSGRNRSVSTPRVHMPRLENPRWASSVMSEGVATIVTVAAAWKHRKAA